MLKLGIIGGSEIAYRMFIPSLFCSKKFELVGVASNSAEKRKKFEMDFGIKTFSSYDDLVRNDDVDAIYIPLPPALHFKWAKKSLENGKHVFLEKPSTTCFNDTSELIQLAKNKQLAITENYMFQYHSQLAHIKELLTRNEIGKIWAIKTSFGFPFRGDSDFRYNKELGGGALFDVGGYIVKLATLFLGESIQLQNAYSLYNDSFHVNIFGAVSFTNGDGLICQGTYGMDCQYQCNLEIWGSQGKISTNRIYTSPNDFSPTILVEKSNQKDEYILLSDNQFAKSIEMFYNAIINDEIKQRLYNEMSLQSELVDKIYHFGR